MDEIQRARVMLHQPGALLLDVRTEDEFDAGNFSGSVLVPTPKPPLNRGQVRTLREMPPKTVGRKKTTPIVI